MSYDDNNNNNNRSNEDDVLNSQWQGSTWTDASYTRQPSEGPESYYNPNYSYSTSSSMDKTKANFEENVLAQSFVFMAVALFISAFTALYVCNSRSILTALVFNQGLFYGLLFAEFVIVIIANITVSKNQIVPSAILFTLYSVINGATLSIIFLIYTTASIVSVFFIAAAMFGSMAIYGLCTKKDLSSLGSLCMMGLWGIIVAGIVNMVFLKSSGFDFAISIIGILVFVGLTAYDTQKIKHLARTTNTENITCIALMGALELYLDFINIFLKLLSILGKNRD